MKRLQTARQWQDDLGAARPSRGIDAVTCCFAEEMEKWTQSATRLGKEEPDANAHPEANDILFELINSPSATRDAVHRFGQCRMRYGFRRCCPTGETKRELLRRTLAQTIATRQALQAHPTAWELTSPSRTGNFASCTLHAHFGPRFIPYG